MKIQELIYALSQISFSNPDVFVCVHCNENVAYDGEVNAVTLDGKDCIVRICADSVHRVPCSKRAFKIVEE